MYEGLYAMSVRDFKLCAKLFLDAISTFTRCWILGICFRLHLFYVHQRTNKHPNRFFFSYELMDYVKFVEYCVWISVLALDR